MTDTLVEIEEYPWNPKIPHFDRVAAWVERMQIVRPQGDRVWGIFYDPQSERAEFYPPPHGDPGEHLPRRFSAPVATSAFIVKAALSEEKSVLRVGWNSCGWNDMRSALPQLTAKYPTEPFVRTTVTASKPVHVERLSPSARLLTLEKKYPVDGLHYVRVGTNSQVENGDIEAIPKLLVDTGCAVTQVDPDDQKQLDSSIHSQLDLSFDCEDDQIGPPASRGTWQSSAHSNHDGSHFGALRATFSQYLRFADNFVAELELYRGPLHLVQRYDEGADTYSTLSVPSMVFGLAVAATPSNVIPVSETPARRNLSPGEVAPGGIAAACGKAVQAVAATFRENEEMDGIFGAALGCDSSWSSATDARDAPDVFAQKYLCAGRHTEKRVPKFTLALGVEEHALELDDELAAEAAKSWMVMGPNNPSDSKDPKLEIIPNHGWSDPMESRDPDGRFWVLNLASYTIGELTHHLPSPVGMIIDTGSSISAFPKELEQSLLDFLGAGKLNYAAGYVNVDNPRLHDYPVTLHFEDGFSITTPSLRSFLDPRARPTPNTVHVAFQSGVVKDTSFGLIGNTLLRGLVMEFEYSANPWNSWKGRMRVAVRDPSRPVRIK
uniref:Peptidase A1 domain-containing protein n=1 Tax=Mycena chlorophos TaxID=658473 RepID=A0ABQ0M5A2_MYCCL|nr:predicted protein [Mycena chlorophos]